MNVSLNKVFIVFLVISYGLLNRIYGQDCVPSIERISIAANATVWWDVASDQSCVITSFQLDIVGDREDEYHFTTTESFMDVSFLEICEKWLFTVTPISNDVIGYHRTLDSYIPLPPGADLTISFFRFTFSGRSILFEWEMRNQTLGDCTLEYRLTLEDLDRGTMEDVYVEGKSAQLDTLSSCIVYQLSLRAINQAHPVIEGPLMRLNLHMGARVQQVPTLQSVDIQATSINMTWALEGDSNRCPLRMFYLDGGSYFQSNVTLQGLDSPQTVSVKIDSLRPNSMYYMTAAVQNSAGISQASPVAIQTLDLSSD